jgi:hypothetical protein
LNESSEERIKMVMEINLITSSLASSCIRLFKLTDVSEADCVSVMRVLIETGSVSETLLYLNQLARMSAREDKTWFKTLS